MTPRYPIPDLDTLPQDIRSRILEVQEKPASSPTCFWHLRADRPSGAPFLPFTMP